MRIEPTFIVTACHGPSGPYDFDDHCIVCGIGVSAIANEMKTGKERTLLDD